MNEDELQELDAEVANELRQLAEDLTRAKPGPDLPKHLRRLADALERPTLIPGVPTRPDPGFTQYPSGKRAKT